MRHSESIAKIADALAKVAAEIENPTKNANNPHFRSKYADLAEIINTARPVLAKYGLAVVQSPGMADGMVTVCTLLTHTSGEWIQGEAASPLPKADPQGVGSAVTYLRRYSLAGMLGLAQEDDDGEAAVDRSVPAARPHPNGNGGAVQTKATPKQLQLVENLMASSAIEDDERNGIQKRIDRGMTKQQASDAIEWLQKTIDERKKQPAAVGAPDDDPDLPF